MSINSRLGKTAFMLATVAIVAAVLAVIGVFAVGADTAPVSVTAKASKDGNTNVVDLSVTNNTAGPVSFEIVATLPTGNKVVYAWPSAYVYNGQTIRWTSASGVGAGKTAVGYQVKFDGDGEVSVNVKYWGTSVGTAATTVTAGSAAAKPAATTQTVSATPTPTPAPPRRGCTACHVLVDKTTGKYTLGYEAEERAEADYGADHPGVAPSGAKIDKLSEANVATCLECHAPSKDNPGKGVGAPITLRDIVHPAHMSSNGFKNNYGGNCFTCHNVRGDGTFELLSEKVDVNDKGVPKVLLQGKGTIPGAIPPSEGKR